MKTKKEFIEDLENNPKEIQDIIEVFGKIRVIERYHIGMRFLLSELEKRDIKWERMFSIDIAIRELGLPYVQEKYESLTNILFLKWLKEKYGRASLNPTVLSKIYPDKDIPTKKRILESIKKPINERELNKGKWDRTEPEPYWKDCGEIIEVGKGHIDVKLNPYSGVPIIL